MDKQEQETSSEKITWQVKVFLLNNTGNWDEVGNGLMSFYDQRDTPPTGIEISANGQASKKP